MSRRRLLYPLVALAVAGAILAYDRWARPAAPARTAPTSGSGASGVAPAPTLRVPAPPNPR